MQMFGAPKRAKNGPPHVEPMPPALRPSPPPARTNPSRRMSEAAAEAAQRWDDLEHELAETKQDLDEERIERQVAERENHRLKDELSRMSTDRDLHRDRVAEIETQFEDVASLLVKVIEKRMTAKKLRPDPVDNLEDEISRIVAADHEAPKL